MEPNLTLDDAVRRWQALREQGKTCAVDDLCGDCPEVAADLSARLRAVASMAEFLGIEPEPDLEMTRGGEDRPSARLAPLAERPLDVPGYEVLGELGRGGMGVVYLARQLNLNRVVALKRILTRHHATPGQLARFRNEARAVAQIRHPNIVQVHEVGEHDGLPYITFEYIRGGSLDRRLTGTPLSPESAARLVELLARAVHAAHERGVVHRDLKPGNILLDDEGTDAEGLGIPKVTDFGLAKLLNSDSNLTMSDSVMGSPSYMAPEQAEGKVREVGPPADVYALGAILYELLTGRPPFRGASVLETLEQVKAAAPAPPSRFVSSLDRDIETIALKCLEKEPSRRYATAANLADDLDRYGRDEPIAARPVGRAERAWRWSRRNPTIAGLCGGIAASLLLGTVASLGFALQARSQQHFADRALTHELEANKRIARARAELEEANKRETARFDLAMEAINFFQGEVSQDLLLKEKQFGRLRSRLLRGAADFYVKLEGSTKGRNDAASRATLGKAHYELGRLTAKISDAKSALEFHEKALALRREIALELAAPSVARLELVRSLLAVGSLRGNDRSIEEALDLARCLEKNADASDEARELQSEALVAIGRRLHGSGVHIASQIPEAIAVFEQARVISRGLVVAHPTVAQYRKNLAYTNDHVAWMLGDIGRLPEALGCFEASRDLYQGLVDKYPTNPEYQLSLMVDFGNLCETLLMLGRTTDALSASRQGLSISKSMVDTYPALIKPLKFEAIFRGSAGEALITLGRNAEAMVEFEKARKSWDRLSDTDPDELEYMGLKSITLSQMGKLLVETGRPADALILFEQARAILRDRLKQSGTSAAGINGRGMGDAYLRLGRLVEASDQYKHAVAVFEEALRAQPTVREFQIALATSLRRLAWVSLEHGDATNSVALSRRAVTLHEQLPFQSARERFEECCAHATLSNAGVQGEAERTIDRLRKAIAMGYRNLAAMQTEPALAPLRTRRDFQDVMLDLAFPPDPFVRDD